MPPHASWVVAFRSNSRWTPPHSSWVVAFPRHSTLELTESDESGPSEVALDHLSVRGSGREVAMCETNIQQLKLSQDKHGTHQELTSPRHPRLGLTKHGEFGGSGVVLHYLSAKESGDGVSSIILCYFLYTKTMIVNKSTYLRAPKCRVRFFELIESGSEQTGAHCIERRLRRRRRRHRKVGFVPREESVCGGADHNGYG